MELIEALIENKHIILGMIVYRVIYMLCMSVDDCIYIVIVDLIHSKFDSGKKI